MEPRTLADNIFAVVVNWNRTEDTLRCLWSLQESVPAAPRVILVDNGSADGGADRIAERFPEAMLLRNSQNEGFARGYNQGIRAALDGGATHILVINNDAYVAPDTLARLRRELEDRGAGLAAPAIYYAGTPEKIWSVGGRFRPLLWEISRDYQNEADKGQLPAILEQDFVTGCCFLAPRTTFQDVGLFDERFRVYYEDFDFSVRLRSAGNKIIVVSAAKAWHNIASSSGGRDSPNERYWMARSSVTFYRKHLRGLMWLPVTFWRLMSAIRTSIRLARRGSTQALKAYWRGLRDGWTRAPILELTTPKEHQ